ncbi:MULTISPECIES: DUF4062 domain-containing protein [Vibrio]|uniref:DUF4062 domain-containing protein n=1 Tax=Vibrio TaxID=662 RepID=UPI000E0C017B|nr:MULTISPECIES: DUF4062 domain-containing protein [Vibrio]
MAKLRVFISSTYYDLKHVRSYVASFIEKMGYEPTLSEKGRIAYDPSNPLDESCYRDASASDILVLIVGGRYGSATSETDNKPSKTGSQDDFYKRYESVTKKEFETAHSHDTPTYILVEKSVMSEYETFKKNRDNTSINYAHVDSINVFHFLDEIFSKGRNNPLFQFDQPQEIESWLKAQWSGYFRTLLENKTQSTQLSSLSNQVLELNSINNSLQRYLEKVIEAVAAETASEFIEEEHNKLSHEKLVLRLMSEDLFNTLVNTYGSDFKDACDAFGSHDTLEDTITHIASLSEDLDANKILEYWTDNTEKINEVNVIRDILGKKPLT